MTKELYDNVFNSFCVLFSDMGLFFFSTVAMGEPVEALEGSDSEISRLFPKCRPRSTATSPTSTQATHLTPDHNLNCVHDSDDNDNGLPATHTTINSTEITTNKITTTTTTVVDDNQVVVHEGPDSTSSSTSRMSVDSGTASSSTPPSHSGSHSSRSGSARLERADEDADVDVSVVSAYDDYDDRFIRSSVLDSSYEEAPSMASVSRSHLNNSQPQIRREHFRLRDSRIEAAGGREVFSQSRSRPARRRHDDARRIHNHLHHHHHPHGPPAPPPPQQYIHQASTPLNESRNSSNSSSSSSVSSSNHSTSSGPSPSDRRNEEDINGGRESPLVYEARLAGSSEVVFDDIGEWVTRGLTVRGVEDPPNNHTQASSEVILQDRSYITYERSTSPSERDSESPEESPARVTKIGNVPIAEYEGSPRRYGPRAATRHHSPRATHLLQNNQRPPRPGFPRRVTNHQEDQINNRPPPVVLDTLVPPTSSPQSRDSSTNHSPSCTNALNSPPDDHQQTHHLSQVKQTSSSHHNHHQWPKATSPVGDENDQDHQYPPEVSNTLESPGPPPVISIPTLSSIYNPTISASSTAMPTLEASSPSIPSNNNEAEFYDDYNFETSETRKVLDEFFKDAPHSNSATEQERRDFFDLEYHLKRHHGNSYVGQRLAAEYEGDEDNPLELLDNELKPHQIQQRIDSLAVKESTETNGDDHKLIQPKHKMNSCDATSEMRLTGNGIDPSTAIDIDKIPLQQQHHHLEEDQHSGATTDDLEVSRVSSSPHHHLHPQHHHHHYDSLQHQHHHHHQHHQHQQHSSSSCNSSSNSSSSSSLSGLLMSSISPAISEVAPNNINNSNNDNNNSNANCNTNNIVTDSYDHLNESSVATHHQDVIITQHDDFISITNNTISNNNAILIDDVSHLHHNDDENDVCVDDEIDDDVEVDIEDDDDDDIQLVTEDDIDLDDHKIYESEIACLQMNRELNQERDQDENNHLEDSNLNMKQEISCIMNGDATPPVGGILEQKMYPMSPSSVASHLMTINDQIINLSHCDEGDQLSSTQIDDEGGDIADTNDGLQVTSKTSTR